MKTKEIPKKQASDYCMSCFFKKGLFLQRQGCGNDAYQPIHFPTIQHVANFPNKTLLPEDSTEKMELRFLFKLFFLHSVKKETYTVEVS